MSDEKVKKKRGSGRSIVSKIARLPDAVREQLNRRMRDNEAATTILQWLNELPDVKRIVVEQFKGAAITHQNLSIWRRSGYEQWLEGQQPFAEIAALAGDANVFSRVSGDKLAQVAATMASARMIKMLHAMPAEECTPEAMAKMSFAISGLVFAEQGEVRLENAKEQIKLRDEQLTLMWDKHQRDVVAITQHVVNDAQIKEIQASPIDNSAKIELIGRRLFGELWQGRRIAKAKESSDLEN